MTFGCAVKTRSIFTTLLIFLVALPILLLVYSLFPRTHVDKGEQTAWLWHAVQELQNRKDPSGFTVTNMAAQDWARDGMLVFSNGWASFAYHTFHDSEGVGDVALLRTSNGLFYVSYYHFCIGEQTFLSQPRPKDFEEFLKFNEARQGWTKEPVSGQK